MRHFWLSIIFSLSLIADAHIFVLHRFDDTRYPSTNTSTEDLKTFFDYLKNNKYKVISLDTLSSALENKTPIDPKWIVFTIDDTFKSFYENALSLFKEYNYPFTLFVYAEATQKKFSDYMSWEEVRESSKYGSLGFHSYSHPHLTKISAQQIKKDTKKSFELFKENNLTASSYAYPYGEYDENVQNAISYFNFKTIVNQNSGAVNQNSNRFDLDRIALTGKININHALNYKHLTASWIEPLKYPKDHILKKIKLKTNEKLKSVEVYVSGYDWQKVKVNKGIIELLFDKKLKSNRVRIIVKTADNKYSSKIIVKD